MRLPGFLHLRVRFSDNLGSHFSQFPIRRQLGKVKELINDLFEEEALVIGGLVAVHPMDNDLVWRLVKNLDVIRTKILRRLEDTAPVIEEATPARRPNLKPHPAIEDFLLTLRRI